MSSDQASEIKTTFAHKKYARFLQFFLLLVFAAFIIFFPISRNLKEWRGAKDYASFKEKFFQTTLGKFFKTTQGSTLAEHLRKREGELEDAPWAQTLRRRTLSELFKKLQYTPQKVVLGKDDWLFYRAGLDSLSGSGALTPEPTSPADPPFRGVWHGALDSILDFAKQLRARNIKLLLVPIPTKPMIYPEKLSGKSVNFTPRHPDTSEFFKKLRTKGILVYEMNDFFQNLKKKREEKAANNETLFLPDDTHWRQWLSIASAMKLADFLKESPLFHEIKIVADKRYGADLSKNWRKRLQIIKKKYSETPRGDLVGMLGVEDEIADAYFVRLLAGGEADLRKNYFQITSRDINAEELLFDEGSPIVFLGDSFSNIYALESMGFGKNGGFAEFLAYELGIPLEKYAINGQGADGSRLAFIKNTQSERKLRTKKLVIWTIAERDIFLSRTPATDLGMTWQRLAFHTEEKHTEEKEWQAPTYPIDAMGKTIHTQKTQLGKIRVKAKLMKRANVSVNPKDTAYKDALFACEYEITQIVDDGTLQEVLEIGKRIIVFHWAFRDRKFSSAMRLEIGDELELNLSPWKSRPDLKSLQKFDLLAFGDSFFAEDFSKKF